MLDKCKTLFSHCSQFICLTFPRSSASLDNTGRVWVNWPIVCGFRMCQVREKPGFMEQLSHRKQGQRRCFVGRDGSQTHPVTCKLYMCLLQRLYHHFLFNLTLTPWTSVSQYPNISCLLGSLVNLTWAKQFIEFCLKLANLFSSISKSNSWEAFNNKKITLYSWKLRQ